MSGASLHRRLIENWTRGPDSSCLSLFDKHPSSGTAPIPGRLRAQPGPHNRTLHGTGQLRSTSQSAVQVCPLSQSSMKGNCHPLWLLFRAKSGSIATIHSPCTPYVWLKFAISTRCGTGPLLHHGASEVRTPLQMCCGFFPSECVVCRVLQFYHAAVTKPLVLVCDLIVVEVSSPTVKKSFLFKQTTLFSPNVLKNHCMISHERFLQRG